MGWTEAADMIERGVRAAINSRKVTFDFAEQMLNATEVSCSQFGKEIVENI